MRRAAFIALMLTSLALYSLTAAVHADGVPTRTEAHPGFTLVYAAADSAWAPRLSASLERGITRVRKFFGAPFQRDVTVRILPTRAALDALWQQAWHAPEFHSECWMVASGTGTELDVLSPNAWATQACEHDAANASHMDKLLAHELTHVYQGQRNVRRELDGMDDLGWFVEGVAVLASGQLEDDHLAPASEAIAKGAAPKELAKAWSGKYRYGVSGSLVRFVDRRVGRRTLSRMLADTTQGQLLSHTGLSETELLERWQRSVTKR